jgi:hypothetical protein
MNLILGCQISGIYDVNRNTTIADDDYGLIKEWADSIQNQGLQCILFHNNFSEHTIATHQNDHLRFEKVTYDSRFNPNVYRYFVYMDFLNQLPEEEIQHVFMTDVSDVVVIKNPYVDSYFLNNQEFIFCGDEVQSLLNDWMIKHSEHLRRNIPDFEMHETQFKNATLLNCGIIGGSKKTIKEFLNIICNIHFQYNQNNTTAYTGDMGVFNYVIRKYFNERVNHGYPCNTIFKAYEIDRDDCWFRHK